MFKRETVGQKLVKSKMMDFELCKTRTKKHRILRFYSQNTVFL